MYQHSISREKMHATIEEDGGVQRRVQQRVPHEDVVVEARAGDVVLLQDVLKPVHTFDA